MEMYGYALRCSLRQSLTDDRLDQEISFVSFTLVSFVDNIRLTFFEEGAAEAAACTVLITHHPKLKSFPHIFVSSCFSENVSLKRFI